MSPAAKKKKKAPAPSGDQPGATTVNFYPAWCKQCGNCAAFCPRQALGIDEWGSPYLADPERCTSCGLCERLCPDFAISVGEGPTPGRTRVKPLSRPRLASPERVNPMGRDAKEGE